MGMMDKVKGLLKGREDQVKQAVGKVGGFVDGKTKGKFHDKIEQVEKKAAEAVDKVSPDKPAGPEGPTAGA
jgi:hypothetical protein